MPSKRFGMVRKRVREAQGLTQQAWAEKAGVTDDSIPRLETGVWKNPTIATLKALANTLGMPVAALSA